jgi:hypothetical protein
MNNWYLGIFGNRGAVVEAEYYSNNMIAADAIAKE